MVRDQARDSDIDMKTQQRMPFGVLLWHRPWRQYSKVQPMRAEYLDKLDQ